MPRRGSGYGRGSLGISEGISALIALQEDRKERKLRELAKKAQAEIAKQKFDADEEWRQYVKDRDRKESLEPDIIGGKDVGYHKIYPDQQNVAGQTITGRREQVIPPYEEPEEPGKWKTMETDQGLFQVNEAGELRPMEFEGQRLTKTKKGKPPEAYPASQARVDKRVEDLAKQLYESMTGGGTPWETESWEVKQKYYGHVRAQTEQGMDYPNQPAIKEIQPEIEDPTEKIKPWTWFDKGQEGIAETTWLNPQAPMGKTPAPQVDPNAEIRAQVKAMLPDATDEEIEKAIQDIIAAGR